MVHRGCRRPDRADHDRRHDYRIPDPDRRQPTVRDHRGTGRRALVHRDCNGDKIGRITTAGTVTEYRASSRSLIGGGIAAGPDGALWFTGAFLNEAAQLEGAIGRITAAGTFSGGGILPTASNLPEGGIAAGPDGALWFTEVDPTITARDKIGRITTDGTITEYPIPVAGARRPGSRPG